nr:hypothetical protein [Brucella anthropi]
MDLGTAISYETAGTFDPWKAGPTTQWGQHRGLIQWGEPQRAKYGVSQGMPVSAQMQAVGNYLRDAGVRPGMGLPDVYSAINAGRVGRYNASDANNGGAPGTVLDKVQNQMAGHRKNAERLLGGPMGGGSPMPLAPKPEQMNSFQPMAQPSQFATPEASVAPKENTPLRDENSALSNLFATLAPSADAMSGVGGVTTPVATGGGDVSATQNAFLGAQNAGQLAAGLAPDIEALLAMGKRAPRMA